MNYPIHDIANIFPEMGGAEFASLCADIKANGLREAIWLYQGAVIDGRHRMRACAEVGVNCYTKTYAGDDPLKFAVSLNLHRRHLDSSQRAMVAARLANMKVGGDRVSEHSANLQNAVSQSQAADLLNVSTRSVAAAARVQEEAPAEVIRAVDRGDMSVSLAAQVTELPNDDQELIAALNESPEKMREVAREVVHNHRAQGTGENEWYTPAEYVDAAREVLGEIDLDPASSEIANARVRAKSFCSIDDDGLSKQWAGRVWLNPPYAQPAILQFIEKLCESVARGGSSSSPHVRLASRIGADSSAGVTEAILLTHNYTDTRWFHVAADHAAAICFTRGRIGFLSPEGKKAAPTQGQAFFYFGPNHRAFADVFSRFGFVVEVARGFRNAEQLDVAA